MPNLLDISESAAKWNKVRPDLLNQARKNDGPCPICEGADLLTEDGETTFYCACKVIAYERRLAARFDLLSHVSQEERNVVFATLDKWGTTQDWGSFKPAVKAAKQFADDPKQWLVLIGGRGCGKSHLMLAAYCELQHRAAYVYVPKLADDFHAAISSRSVPDLVEAYADVPVLFLDDLGAEHAGSDFVAAVLDNIVQRRYQWRKLRPTAVATNLTRKELNQRYERLASRILDWQLSQVFTITLGDFRQKNAVEEEFVGKEYARIIR